MNYLPDLHNMYEEILTDDYLKKEEKRDLEEVIINIIIDYLSTNPTAIAEEDFYNLLEDHIEEQISIINENFAINEVLAEELEDFINQCIDTYFQIADVPRSYTNTFENEKVNIPKITEKIDFLRSIPQPVQRTNEWYTARYQLLTASNVYKAFESEAMRNQLIYEKCKPLVIYEPGENSRVNTDSTLHWGQKYEPISVMIYENLYNTKIEDFGCIPHPVFKFLGASPDGINVDKKNGRYGRMLEIKNVVNREITGIPKKEYWIQMQQQMEVCNLEECDFLETKFSEIEVDEFYQCNNIYKGVIMYFNTNTGEPKYLYIPLELKTKDEVNEWTKNQLLKMPKEEFTWVSNLYWKLEKYSCVLVPRNHNWFNSNVQILVELWEIITKERVSGYEHRQPRKKEKKTESCAEEIPPTSGCLLKINKDNNKVAITN